MPKIEWAPSQLDVKQRDKILAVISGLETSLQEMLTQYLGKFVAQFKRRAFADEVSTDDFENIDAYLSYATELVELGANGAVGEHSAAAANQQRVHGGELIKGVLSNYAKVLNNRIATGLEQGLSRDQIAESLLSGTNTSLLPEWRARLIAQTEGIRAYNAGSVARYQDLGLEKIKWLDGQVQACADCTELHNKTRPLDGKSEFVSERARGLVTEYPPLHPGCRCTVIGDGEAKMKTTPSALPAPKAGPKTLEDGYCIGSGMPDNEFLVRRSGDVGGKPFYFVHCPVCGKTFNRLKSPDDPEKISKIRMHKP